MSDRSNDEEMELVQRRRVYYEVHPEFEMLAERRQQVGLELRLWGMHSSGVGPIPGCDRCREIHQDLATIVRGILPSSPLVVSEVRPFDPALYDVPSFRTDAIYLGVGARSTPDGSAKELDAWLRDARVRLHALGIHEGSWHPNPH